MHSEIFFLLAVPVNWSDAFDKVGDFQWQDRPAKEGTRRKSFFTCGLCLTFFCSSAFATQFPTV